LPWRRESFRRWTAAPWPACQPAAGKPAILGRCGSTSNSFSP
jgi:hypothetical protein